MHSTQTSPDLDATRGVLENEEPINKLMVTIDIDFDEVTVACVNRPTGATFS